MINLSTDGISMNPEDEVSVTTSDRVTTDTTNDITMDVSNNDEDIQVDSNIIATDKIAHTPFKEEPSAQDSLYNFYSKTYPELFKGGKLVDIEGAKEKGIISEYNYVPTEDSTPIAAHSSTIYESTDDFPPTAYRYNEQEEFQLAKKESLAEQTESSFRIVNLFNEKDEEPLKAENLPDAYGEYLDGQGNTIEIPFMNGQPLQGIDVSNLTPVKDSLGEPIVKNSLMKSVAEIPVIGPSLLNGLLEVANSIEYVPAAFKDIIEQAGNVLYKNDAVWDSMNTALKATSNRSFANPKDMAEQLADGAGAFKKVSTSSLVTRPFLPVPLILEASRPFSAIKRRTDGVNTSELSAESAAGAASCFAAGAAGVPPALTEPITCSPRTVSPSALIISPIIPSS